MPVVPITVLQWFAFAFALVAAPPVSPSAERLTASQVEADVRLAQMAYARIHPGYDRYTDRVVLDQAWEAVVERAVREKGLSVGTFFLEVQAVLARIRCDHTKAEIGRKQVAWRKANPAYLPFRWDVRDARAVVVRSNLAEVGPGDELLSIDGVAMPTLVKQTLPLIPADGDTLHAREAGLGHSLEFRGGGVEHFALERGDVPPEATLEIRRPNGAVKTVSVARVPLDTWRELTVEPGSSFVASVREASFGPETAYLAVDSFVNYREPVRPDAVFDPVFKRLKKSGKTTLILDLRKNGGGSEDALQRMYAHLIRTADRLVRDVRAQTLNRDGLREHLYSWDKRILNPRRWWFRQNDDGSYSLRRFLNTAVRKVRPDHWAFDGRLIVLSSRENSSAVSTLLANLADNGRATIVGEPTGGSAEGVTANVLVFLRLPHSDFSLRIPCQRIYNDVRTYVPGRGVAPDVVVVPTAEDLIHGRDPVLEAAKTLASVPAG